MESVKKKIEENSEQFRNLSAHLQEAREEERKMIAREIHDELGQALTTMQLQLTLLREEVLSDAIAATNRIDVIKKQIGDTIQSVKRIITKLRPGLLDDLGLSAAIEWQANEFQRHTGIVCELHIYSNEKHINAEISTAIFRIFQEILTNVTRHSNATRVSINLKQAEDSIELQVDDNGRGITEEELNDPKSFGIIGMKERAQYWNGSIDIIGKPRNGTTIIARFPIISEASK